MKINKLINVSLVSLCALGLAMLGFNTHADDKNPVVNNHPSDDIQNTSTTGPLSMKSVNGIHPGNLDIRQDGNVNAPVSISSGDVTANFDNFTGTDQFKNWSLSVSGEPLTNSTNGKKANAVINLGDKIVTLDGKQNGTQLFNNTGIAEGKGTSLKIATNPTMHVTDKSLPQAPNTTNTYSTTLNWNLGAATPSNPGK
ncbi:hypothetical protein DY037_00620 [Apilactobacillus micheneri]|uniref:WxL domain-containing protein n=1 Tax=Apilactobacillus micheneri TaxID=1899430 RepID=A0A9Q8MTD4_9LACO|nr:hypothetical protein [Apilactobacillus micheneri]TPR26291.1 hypothetical protein DY114_00935 [Apilactobacillus micheneri]TPR27045.1 hypothetical protein DY111_00935 [Apilactobacillus micheneri]TPR27903.1 hypothetical protein DY113_04710 [Apilactobacillus micheneri]TPR31808.1 hypothetical protein DY117_00935 [Apilactobacillus micheneri]TPR32212.1 hypothetical protein DY120_00935 [Apilactobacillus micheneri]